MLGLPVDVRLSSLHDPRNSHTRQQKVLAFPVNNANKESKIIAHQCDCSSWVVRGEDDLPMDGVASPSHERIGLKTRCSTRPTTIEQGFANTSPRQVRTCLSTLELIVATNPPVLESLLLQLPTASIISLYHTSRFLQSFLRSYPLAWTHISFRLSTAGRSESRQASPASDASGESLTRCSKPHALDQLLLSIVIPFGIRLKSLVLDHTSVSGVTLTAQVLVARRETLEHLSVRGCKHVSLKYHIVPYLTIYKLQKSVGERNSAVRIDHLALKSLYAFRCRHHRRRPYLPASLLRRDSDADPTHELIKMCHQLGIWTDTAWCPTPGGRCLRRKDYYTGRGNLDGRGEVWVVFDRLWRSGNMLGPSNTTQLNSKPSTAQLWETSESGQDGEPLGCSGTPGEREGKMVPTHLRRSHRMFVDNFTCHDCGELIQERCEQCSVRMHCVGCRKILCASCAFAKPLPPKERSPDEATRKEGENLFWWAPGSTRSPNLMMQEWSNDGLVGGQPNSAITPTINMNWCCLKPMFSGGSGILIGGPGVTGSAAEQIRCAPLPKGNGWEDSEFMRIRQHGRPDVPDYNHGEGHDSRLQWLLHGSGSEDNIVCPRNLCQECWQTPDWKDSCQACQEPFCFAHDLRGLKMRICGYRDLGLEKAKMEADDALENMRGLVAMNTQELASLTSLPDTLDEDLEVEPRSVIGADDAFENLHTPQLQDELHALPEILPPPFSESSSTSSSKSSLPKWYGCAAYLCPEFRAIGDHRSKCTAAAKECTGCGVHVCPVCLTKDPPCDCSPCAERYHCPNCQRAKPPGSCKKAEEEELKRLEELEAQSRLEKEMIQAQRLSAEELERLGDEALEGVRYLFTFALADDGTQELPVTADDESQELAAIAGDDDGSQELAVIANDGSQELPVSIADEESQELAAIADVGSQILTTQDLAANATAALVAVAALLEQHPA